MPCLIFVKIKERGSDLYKVWCTTCELAWLWVSYLKYDFLSIGLCFLGCRIMGIHGNSYEETNFNINIGYITWSKGLMDIFFFTGDRVRLGSPCGNSVGWKKLCMTDNIEIAIQWRVGNSQQNNRKDGKKWKRMYILNYRNKQQKTDSHWGKCPDRPHLLIFEQTTLLFLEDKNSQWAYDGGTIDRLVLNRSMVIKHGARWFYFSFDLPPTCCGVMLASAKIPTKA